ncbi:MAG: DNA topoisomerase VI subunit B [Phycisphaerales bacterium]
MCAAARPKSGAKKKTRATAESMAASQREISVSEFFAKNRHLLGFDNPRKALLTTVKEAVDNALDACEEASILPDITVKLEELVAPPSPSKPGRYLVTITDNGPGIVRKQVENIFGKLLYGSKFHKMKMSRGQQGIGISAAGMYGLMTTGKPMIIHTKPNKKKPAHHIQLAMDTTKNKPEVTVDVETDDFPETSSGTGTMVAIELEARYQKGKASVDTYLEQTAIANPHASFTFIPPDKASEDPTLEPATPSRGREHAEIENASESGESPRAHARGSGSTDDIVRTTELADRIEFPRTIDELPEETSEIKPHPYGVELGMFLRMLKQTEEKQLGGFFKREFCRVTPGVIKDVTEAASTKGKSITGQTWLKNVDHAAAEKLYKALQEAKLRAPPTDCLSPIGVRQMLAGLLKGVKAEFYAASTRAPAVYRGNPFQIEAAIAFGGDLPGDQTARVIRFANRVPLLYQQSACSAFKAVVDTSWKNYGMTQPRGAAPVGPLVVMIHMASVWVPFTSESKEAIADYDDIRKEMKLALQECGRKLGTYIRKRQKMRREGQRRDVFERYIGEISKACNALVGVDTQTLYDALLEQARSKTAIADAQLDEDGNIVTDDSNGRLDDDDGVLIVRTDDPDDDPTNEPPASAGGRPEPKPAKKRRAKAAAKRQPAGSKPKRVTKKRPKSKAPAKGIKNKGKPKPRVKLGERNLFEG